MQLKISYLLDLISNDIITYWKTYLNIYIFPIQNIISKDISILSYPILSTKCSLLYIPHFLYYNLNFPYINFLLNVKRFYF